MREDTAWSEAHPTSTKIPQLPQWTKNELASLTDTHPKVEQGLEPDFSEVIKSVEEFEEKCESHGRVFDRVVRMSDLDSQVMIDDESDGGGAAVEGDVVIKEESQVSEVSWHTLRAESEVGDNEEENDEEDDGEDDESQYKDTEEGDTQDESEDMDEDGGEDRVTQDGDENEDEEIDEEDEVIPDSVVGDDMEVDGSMDED
jgi:hypothetical protein